MNSMRKHRILIVCPEPQGLALLTSMLKSLGHLIEEAATDRAAVRLMERNPINLVLASVDPGDAEALDLLSYTRRKYPDVPVILMFPRVHQDRAKEALRLGAMAVLKYPVPAAELRAAVLQALEQCAGHPLEVVSLPAATPAGASAPAVRPQPNHAHVPSAPAGATLTNGFATYAAGPPPAPAAVGTYMPHLVSPPAPAVRTVSQPNPVEVLAREIDLVTADPGLKQIVELAGTLAHSPASVLIVGEPGTGKSLLAHLLHSGGANPDRPFVTLRAEHLGETVIGDDGEYLPSDPAAALSEWAAALSQARGGTLHIEEIGALPLELQLQLLRELQLQDFEAASSHGRLPVRPLVRFILSTSENLPGSVEQGRFRPDLYHRISSLCLMVPPLRHRGADVELLAEHFRAAFARDFRKDVDGLTRDALEALQRHDWPGNIRELKGVIQRAVTRCTGPRITSSHLAPILSLNRQSRGGTANTSRPHLPAGIRPLKEALEEPEKRIIIQALQAFNWNRQETARVLDINRTTLYKKMKKYGLLIDEPMWVN